MSLSEEIRKFSFTGSGTSITVVDEVPSGKFHHKCNCREYIPYRKVGIWKYRKKSEYRDTEFMITDHSDTFIVGKEKMKNMVKENNYFGCRSFGGKTHFNGGLVVTGTKETIQHLCDTANEKNIDKDYLLPLYIGNMDEGLYKIGKKFECEDTITFNYCIKKVREQLVSKYPKSYLLTAIKKTEEEQYIYLPSGKSRLMIVGNDILPEDSLHSSFKNAFIKTGIDFGTIDPVESFQSFPVEFFFITLPNKEELEMLEIKDSEDKYHSLFVREKIST